MQIFIVIFSNKTSIQFNLFLKLKMELNVENKNNKVQKDLKTTMSMEDK